MRAYKTELRLTDEQKNKILRTLGTCRFVYNMYLAHNKEVYEREKRFVSAMEFAKWLNNVFLPNNTDYSWIKEVSTKSVRKSIFNAETAFKRFFKKQSKFPKFKKKGKQDVKMYLDMNGNLKTILCERHRVKVPTLGWLQLKEYGYFPTNQIITGGTISVKAGHFYISVTTKESTTIAQSNTNEPIGIDLGVKFLATCSNGMVFNNINKSSDVKKLEKKLRREQRSLSRKLENKKGGGTATEGHNIRKSVLKVQRLHFKLSNIRSNYINNVISTLVKTKPEYITIEDLNISGMMKNRHLSKAIQNQCFYYFISKLAIKCSTHGIELRIVDRFFPSSKMCHACGKIKHDLKLSDRTYVCDCGYSEDRDKNASDNLVDAKVYRIA